MTGRCLFGFSGEKPFLLPDNEGVKMNTSPVRMDDLPLNRFHCRIAALTFGARLTDGYVLGVIGYAIIQLTPAIQLTPFMAGMIGGSALLGLFLGSLVLGWISDHIGRQKIFTFSFLLITLASFLQFFATTPEHLIGLRILIGIGLEDALTASLMLNALLIVGALLGLVLTHLLAHRKFLLGSFLLLAATLVVMACLPSGSSLTLLLFVLFSTTISAVSNLVGILPAESFPTDIRSLGVGFATAMSRLGAAVSTGLLPWVLAQWGMQVTLLLLATVLLVGFVVTWLWAPETKALPLVAAGNVGGANEHSVSV